MIRKNPKIKISNEPTRGPRQGLASLLAALGALWMLGGCASPWPNESAELAAQGSATALGIKAALIDEPGLAGAAIDVTMVDNRARLTGFVETNQQRHLAARIAGDYDGVVSVVNEIVVK